MYEMDDKLLTVAIPAAVGLVSGAIGSLIAPWVRWGVEKRRLKRQDQKELLEAARKVLTTETTGQAFVKTVEWSRLRPYIREDLRKELEGKALVLVVGGGRGDVTIWILDEIARIEREWGLI